MKKFLKIVGFGLRIQVPLSSEFYKNVPIIALINSMTYSLFIVGCWNCWNFYMNLSMKLAKGKRFAPHSIENPVASLLQCPIFVSVHRLMLSIRRL